MNVLHINGRFWMEAIHEFIRVYDELLPTHPELRHMKMVYANGYYLNFIHRDTYNIAQLSVSEPAIFTQCPVNTTPLNSTVQQWIDRTLTSCGYVLQTSEHIYYQHPDASSAILVTAFEEMP